MIDEARVVSALAPRAIVPDASQRAAIAALVALLGGPARRRSPGHAPTPLGVYCHGLPGRGKSLVVDTVFELAECTKRRIHFHEFLREINRRLVNEPRGDDRLGSVSRQWLDGIALLCFDEFHVHDIADAFLLARFLEVALALGTRIVQHFPLIPFDGARDYRFSGAAAERPRFFAPLGASTGEQVRRLFVAVEGENALGPQTLSAAGRPLRVHAAGAALMWVGFDELCGASRSHLDYLDLAERWQGLIVDPLHTHALAKAHTLQRFVWLVDIFYDRKRALFIASDQPIASALGNLEGAHDLSRTLSRLAEMQSRAYPNPFDGEQVSSDTTVYPV